jgi:hypothetical protein
MILSTMPAASPSPYADPDRPAADSLNSAKPSIWANKYRGASTLSLHHHHHHRN